MENHICIAPCMETGFLPDASLFIEMIWDKCYPVYNDWIEEINQHCDFLSRIIDHETASRQYMDHCTNLWIEQMEYIEKLTK